MNTVRDALARGPQLVLVSAYLMYHEAVQQMCGLAADRDIPVVLGGPAFHEAKTRREWLRMPGLTGIYAGEAEGAIVELVESIRRGDDTVFAGFTRADGPDNGLAEPLGNLDDLPFPDYDDFPWDCYPNRIVSMLTGRGCGWGACRFCSDVVTVGGRSFRSRSLENVLSELKHHHDRYQTSLFCFSDLKLNSDLEVWRGLHEGVQRAVPGAKWTCAVHVGPRDDEGLTTADLRAARKAGLVRITAGFETASQALLDSMRKGTTPERLEEFLVNAHEAGISTRVTAFTGYPGEEPADLEATTEFLDRVRPHLDRVSLSRLLVQHGTPLERDLRTGRISEAMMRPLEVQPLLAETSHVSSTNTDPESRRAVTRLLRTVHSINRERLPDEARELSGAM